MCKFALMGKTDQPVARSALRYKPGKDNLMRIWCHIRNNFISDWTSVFDPGVVTHSYPKALAPDRNQSPIVYYEHERVTGNIKLSG